MLRTASRKVVVTVILLCLWFPVGGGESANDTFSRLPHLFVAVLMWVLSEQGRRLATILGLQDMCAWVGGFHSLDQFEN